MLAVKENIGIRFDFADGVHPIETSSPYARLRVKLRRGEPRCHTFRPEENLFSDALSRFGRSRSRQ